ncbi:MAG: NADP-dependent oxidoreductase [Anaerolineae bacterium]|nr:NADP-dependent oxidoreductase [Anaerolineae bacterium]
MKAARIHAYGEPDVLKYEDAPRPEPAAGEVLVKVHAIGLNPVDWKTRAGSGMSGRYGNQFPMIIGWDISGVVEAVGSSVTKFKVGDAVFGMVRFPDNGNAYAEYVAAPEHDLALKPQNVDFLQAAAIPLAALTAWQGFFEEGDLQSGQSVFIQAGAGGVGHLAVQIAKAKGAYVISTASTANVEFVRSLGADEVIDYRTTRVEEAVTPVDFALDTVGAATLAQSLRLVKAGGQLVSIAGQPDMDEAQRRGIKASRFLVHTNESQLAQIAALMAAGKLKTTVTQVFPLAETAQAHQAGETRDLRRGKIVLQVVP